MPSQGPREHAAEQQTERAAADGDEQVGAHRPSALTRLREVGDDERENGRRRERSTQALREAGDDEDRLIAGKPAGGRGRGEQRDAAEEDLLAPNEIAQPAGDEKEAAIADQITVDDPGKAGLADSQIMLDDGQCNIHHTGVKNDHKLGRQDDEKGEPPSV